MADRISLSREWFERGVQLLEDYGRDKEPRLLFEAYIYLWISLTVASKEYCASDGKRFSNENGEKTTDKEEILHWAIRCRKSQLMSMLQENESIILELCERNGSVTNSPIMDVESDKVADYHREFIRFWHGEARYADPASLVRTFILILNRVRNNLFHGGKSFRVEDDIELLEFTCPLLKETTKLCIQTL